MPVQAASPRGERLLAGSPIALVALCAATQCLAGRFIGVWAWVPTMLVFWLAIFLLLRHEGLEHSRRRFGPAAGSRLNTAFWSTLAVLAGLLSLPGFLRHASLLDSTSLVLAWLVFALFNPWFEEAYWRGLLMDRSRIRGRWPSLL